MSGLNAECGVRSAELPNLAAKSRIAWRNKASGRSGTGPRVFAQAEALALVAELNREYPGFEHWAVPAEKREAAEVKG
jgi:hypothetical protein